MKKVISFFTSIVVIFMFSTSVFAESINLCVHLTNDLITDKVMSKVVDSEVEMVRTDILWSEVETVIGERSIPEDVMNKIDKLNDEGIKILAILDYGNPIYGVADGEVIPTSDNDAYFKGWLNYVTFVVNALKGKVEAYEVWNEPDITTNGASAATYVELLKATYGIIDVEDPTATIIGGVVAGDHTYIDEMFAAGAGAYMDAFSFHTYADAEDGIDWYSENTFENMEDILDKYEFAGEVWLTETGSYTGTVSGAVSEEIQAAYAVRNKVAFDFYLYNNSRTGEVFNYQIIDGTNSADKESNFGILNYNAEPKPAYNAIKSFNKATKGKSLVSVTEPQTARDGFILYDYYYGKLAEYSGVSGKTYVAYDLNGRSDTSLEIPLSGDVAYVYDYVGNVTQTITDTSGTVTLSVNQYPQIVECLTYSSFIDALSYDAEKNVMTIKGKYTASENGTVTIEVLNSTGNVVQTETAVVIDNTFNKWFSVDEDGEYTVRVAQPELSAFGKTSGWATKNISVEKNTYTPSFAAGTVIEYTEATKTVNVSGYVNNFLDNQFVTILAVPESADFNNLDLRSIGYIKQQQISDGYFSFEFELPEYYDTRTAIYLGGTSIAIINNETVDIQESPYAYVGSVEANVGDTLSATALVRNYAGTERKEHIILAQYSDDMQLKDVQLKEIIVPARTYTQTAYTLDNVAKVDGATKCKAFVWDDLLGIVPLIEPDEATIN